MKSVALVTWVGVLAACSHAGPPARVVVPPPAQRESPPRTPEQTWPVPVRVMTWSGGTAVELGELPDHPPAVMPPATPWFVEPIATDAQLDERTFARLVAAVRKEAVPGLSLAGLPVAKARLAQLRDLPRLTALVLSATDVDAAAIDAIGDLALTRLYVARTAVDDAAIARAAARFPHLEVIDAEDCERVGDGAARALATLADLHAVALAGTAITDAGGAALASGAAHGLAIVDLGRTRAGAATVAALAHLPLTELFLDQTAVPPAALPKLAPLAATLERFDFSLLDAADHIAQGPDAQLAWLATSPHLVEANLTNTRVGDALVGKLIKLPALRELRIAHARITLPVARAIAARAELEVLDLADTVADDEVAAGLLAHPRLRVLRLDRDNVSDAAFTRAPIASPQLAELDLLRTNVGDTGMAILDGLAPTLVTLSLGETVIGEPTLARIAKLSHLTTLVLQSVRPRDGHAFAGIGQLHELERLYLAEARVADDEIAAFGALTRLRVLHLQGTDASPATIDVLRGMPLLEELAIGESRMTGAAIADASAWTRLRTLSLQGLALGDADVAVLAKTARAIVELDLSATGVTDPAPLVGAMPRLRIVGLAQLKLSAAGEASALALAKRHVKVVR